MQVNANASVIRCPDGRHRIALQLGAGPCTFGIMLNGEGAEEFADQLAGLVRDAARQCKLANGGLVMPTIGPLPDMPSVRPPDLGSNGRRR